MLTRIAVQERSGTSCLILISGYIHDVSDYVEEHPGGKQLIESYRGKDATSAFCGGLYTHSNAAHNVGLQCQSSMMTLNHRLFLVSSWQ